MCMKFFSFLSLLFILILNIEINAQVFSALDEVEGKNEPGFYTNIKGEEKEVEDIWVHYLGKFGSVKKGKRNTYLSRSVNIPNVPYADMRMKSKIHYGSNEELKMFVSIEVENGKDYLVKGVNGYTEATIWLEDFKPFLEKEIAFRKEKKKLDDLYFEKERIFKSKDRINREIQNNKDKIEEYTNRLNEANAEALILEEKSKQIDLEIQEIDGKIDDQAKKSEEAKGKIP